MDAPRALVKPSGFREYDARWLYQTEIDLGGVHAVGLALGTLLAERNAGSDIVTGHDFRAYSEEIHESLNSGLQAAGCVVHDIGLALTPTAYFAQYALDVPAVAMVTASHNENGWTGIKMGFNRPFTFGPEDMAALKSLALSGRGRERKGGRFKRIDNMKERYTGDLTNGRKLKRALKVVVACGNGTAGAFAPQVFHALGCQVVPLHCELDHAFPHYNPNPEDLSMLRDVSGAVLANGTDIGLAFDGDGDRCGVVDNEGNAIFADKMGVLLARTISARHPGAKFVVDVKCTGLFHTDPLLRKNGAQTEYWKTGHSYLKRRTAETGAIAGFEKSGHYFFCEPYGRGYDDGLLSGIAICEMLAASQGSLADLYRDLPRTWASPTMSPSCPDSTKYQVVEAASRYLEDLRRSGTRLAGRAIVDCLKVNGVRVMLDDGSWVLVRASSNKPELAVVCESPVSEAGMRDVFTAIEELLSSFPEVGNYNQRI